MELEENIIKDTVTDFVLTLIEFNDSDSDNDNSPNSSESSQSSNSDGSIQNGESDESNQASTDSEGSCKANNLCNCHCNHTIHNDSNKDINDGDNDVYFNSLDKKQQTMINNKINKVSKLIKKDTPFAKLFEDKDNYIGSCGGELAIPPITYYFGASLLNIIIPDIENQIDEDIDEENVHKLKKYILPRLSIKKESDNIFNVVVNNDDNNYIIVEKIDNNYIISGLSKNLGQNMNDGYEELFM